MMNYLGDNNSDTRSDIEPSRVEKTECSNLELEMCLGKTDGTHMDYSNSK